MIYLGIDDTDSKLGIGVPSNPVRNPRTISFVAYPALKPLGLVKSRGWICWPESSTKLFAEGPSPWPNSP